MRESWWSEAYPLSRAVLVGRGREFSLLNSALIQGQHSAVLIEGSPGIGKTALAAAFVRSTESSFPGGIIWIQARNLESDTLVPKITAKPPHPTLATLIVLDGIDEAPTGIDWVPLNGILAEFPAVKILMTARYGTSTLFMEQGFHAATLPLGSLTLDETQALLRIAGAVSDEITPELLAFVSGNPLLANLAKSMTDERKTKLSAIVNMVQPYRYSGLVSPDGRPLNLGSSSARRIVVDVRTTNEAILRKIGETPSVVYSISPRQFEEIAAEVFERLGYKVELTPSSNDGGRDIYIARKNQLGSLLYYVECKRYAPNRPVGVGLVRSLYGVVEAGRVTAGLLLATSHFTKGAKEFQRQVEHRLTLRDYVGFQELLHDAGFKQRGSMQ
jgi:restriction system protein